MPYGPPSHRQGPTPLSGYVYKTGRNLALKRLRYDSAAIRDSRYNVPLEELAGCLPGEAFWETVSARALGRAIDAYLDTLSVDNRSIFLRRYWFGDSIREIATSFAMSENAVSVRLNRARNALREYLLKEGLYYE